MIEEFEKQCSRCLETKPTEAFYQNSKRSGRMTYCKRCHNIVTIRWRKEHPKQAHEHDKKSRGKNKTEGGSFFVFRVNEFERSQIENLADAWECTMSDVVRRVLRSRAIELGIIVDTADGSIQFSVGN